VNRLLALWVLYDSYMTRSRRGMVPRSARGWAYPLWWSVRQWGSADAVAEDVDWWVRCYDDAELLELDQYSQFTYLATAFAEFRTLIHYRLREAPVALRRLLQALYRPEPTLTLGADRIGPGLFIQHGFATIVEAESIGSHCWINQQVTIGYNFGSDTVGRPTLGDRVRVHAGAVVIGPITLHDDVIVGANATVVHDVGPGETVVGPVATVLNRRRDDGGAQN
jgi:serine O-acetyltransferase